MIRYDTTEVSEPLVLAIVNEVEATLADTKGAPTVPPGVSWPTQIRLFAAIAASLTVTGAPRGGQVEVALI